MPPSRIVIASIGDGTVPYGAVTDVFLVGGVRTPFGRYRGALADARPDDLAALVVREALTRGRVPDDAVDEVILGAANQAGEDNRNVARMAILLAGLPDAVPGYTVNRLCASSLQAVASAAQQIRSGEADVVVAGGVESMTRAPSVLAKPGRAYATPPELADTTLGWRLVNPRMRDVDGGKATISLGDTAEEVAILDGITREDSDAFGLRSQQLAAASAERRRADLVAVPVGRTTVDADEVPRADTTMEALAGLRPAFRGDGIVTAGSASPLSDGAAAIVVVSAAAVERHGLEPRARVVAAAAAGVPPHIMGLGPVPSTERVLARAGWTTDDLDAIEINEAFAPQVIASVRRLGLDPARVNADGGAIALGHPLGASGARLVLDLLRRLEHDGGRRGLATLCIGVGQGLALLVERPA
jgi:acetyl-CoA acetyltransferase family protein